jgi:hypothetical protein
VLEDRVVPSGLVIPVTSTLDTANYPTTVTFAQLQAANFANVTLTDAINAANNGPAGQQYVIQLQATTYSVNTVNNNWYGPNAFPAITSNIDIQGNGATIDRNGAVPMRFFFVAGQSDLNPGLAAGFLTLEDLTLEDGLVQGGSSGLGGGGLGAGGAIFNFGNLNVVGVTLFNNQAIGGSSGGEVGSGGGGMGTGSDPTGNGGGFGGGFSDPAAALGGPGSSGTGGGGAGPGNADGSNDGLGGSLPNLPAFISGGEGGSNSGSVALSGASGGDFGSGGFASDGGGGGGAIGSGGGASSDAFGSNAGSGGFGGGGGGVTAFPQSPSEVGQGGFGGFGAGGGGFVSGDGGSSGSGGFGGGDGGAASGGGGAGMGGAIFNLLGNVQVINSTLTGNTAQGGAVFSSSGATPGAGMGGGIFNVDGAVLIADSTIAFNNALTGASNSGNPFPTDSSDGGAVYNLALGGMESSLETATVNLFNSILSNSNATATEHVSDLTNNSETFSPQPSATVTGSADLIMSADDFNNNEGGDVTGTGGDGVAAGIFASTADPLLGALQNNGGPTPTMAISAASPAFGIGDVAALDGLLMAGIFPLDLAGNPIDQRGLLRIDPSRGQLDLGAFEVDPPSPVTPVAPPSSPPAPTTQPVHISVPVVPVFLPVLVPDSSPVPVSTTPSRDISTLAIAINLVAGATTVSIFETPLQGGSAALLAESSEGLDSPAAPTLFVPGLADGSPAAPPTTPQGGHRDRPMEQIRMKALRLGASLTEGDDSVGLVEQLLAVPSPATLTPATITPSTPPSAPAPAPPPGEAEQPKQQSRLPWLVLPWVALGAILNPLRAGARRPAAHRDRTA